MSRFRALAGSALVLGLLVLPPAVSAGQQQAPAGDATGAQATDPGLDPSEGGASGGGSPAPASGSVEVQHTGTAKTTAAAFAASLTVSIGDNFYSPAPITIKVGGTVLWSNDGKASHSATASDGSFDTGILAPGESASHTFTKPGTFNYFCLVHGTAQSGTVTVTASSSSGGGGKNGGKNGGGKSGGGTKSGGGGGGTSEAAAVGSPGAAGSSSSLPFTGENVLAPLAVGLLLLGAGLALRLRGRVGSA